MITAPGVAFQPGLPQNTGQPNTGGGAPPTPQSNVQEAIKVLSLRLPRVVGANALAPAPLLQSQGSGSNPRVDSVVNAVLRRMFPTDPVEGGDLAPSPQVPVIGQPEPGVSNTMPVPSPSPNQPTFTGDYRDHYSGRPRQPPMMQLPPELNPIPRFVPGDEPMTPAEPQAPDSTPPNWDWLRQIFEPATPETPPAI